MSSGFLFPGSIALNTQTNISERRQRERESQRNDLFRRDRAAAQDRQNEIANERADQTFDLAMEKFKFEQQGEEVVRAWQNVGRLKAGSKARQLAEARAAKLSGLDDELSHAVSFDPKEASDILDGARKAAQKCIEDGQSGKTGLAHCGIELRRILEDTGANLRAVGSGFAGDDDASVASRQGFLGSAQATLDEIDARRTGAREAEQAGAEAEAKLPSQIALEQVKAGLRPEQFTSVEKNFNALDRALADNADPARLAALADAAKPRKEGVAVTVDPKTGATSVATGDAVGGSDPITRRNLEEEVRAFGVQQQIIDKLREVAGGDELGLPGILNGTLQSLSALGESGNEIAARLRAQRVDIQGNLDPSARKAVDSAFNPNVQMSKTLLELLAAQIAISNNPGGRISDKDIEVAKSSLGLKEVLGNPADLESAFQALEFVIDSRVSAANKSLNSQGSRGAVEQAVRLRLIEAGRLDVSTVAPETLSLEEIRSIPREVANSLDEDTKNRLRERVRALSGNG